MLLKTNVPFSCPTCGNRLVFRTESATAVVCPRCQTVNRRATVEVNAPKVQEDMSILRIGTTGQYQGLDFEVIGRIQYFFKEGYRNHWYVLTSKGEEMWLGEWAGNYSFFKEVPLTSTAKIAGSKPGDKLTLSTIEFQVELLDEETETFIDGEVPESNSSEHGFITIELLQPATYGMAILNIYSRNNFQAFVGQYQYLEDLKLQNLREYHEWI